LIDLLFGVGSRVARVRIQLRDGPELNLDLPRDFAQSSPRKSSFERSFGGCALRSPVEPIFTSFIRDLRSETQDSEES